MTTQTATTLTIPTADLAARLAAVARIAENQRMASPIAGIRWRIEGGELYLESVGSAIAIRTTIPIGDQPDVTFTLAAKVSLEVAKAAPAPTATFVVSDGEVVVRSGAAEWSLRTLRNTDVPPMSVENGGEVVSLPAADFVAATAKVEKSAARDPKNRPILAGVLVELDGDQLSMVATDAYRLAKKTKSLASSTGAGFRAVIPFSTLNEVARLAEDSETIDLRVDELRLVASSPTTTIAGRLIDGQYPNYGQLLNEELPYSTTVSTAELNGAVRRALVTKPTQIVFSFSAGELSVRGRSIDVGQARESIPIAWDHPDVLIAFNVEYLRAGIDLIDGATTTLTLKSDVRPMTMAADGDESFVYLVMPLRPEV